MKIKAAILAIGIITINACNTNNKQPDTKTTEKKHPQKNITYHTETAKQWLSQHATTDSPELKTIVAVNRTDLRHFKNMDTVIIPDDAKEDIGYYLSFPFAVKAIKDINKIIFFSYVTQTFGAYEKGELIYTGPTNMGRKKDPTPTGLYFTNWKAEKTTSTFNDEWDLHWNFNIENKLGIGWHQYDLPGYPASHSCLRLQEGDARYLYTWANQWVIEKDSILHKGTPVIVFGSYNFDGPKPWMQLVKDPHALDISENMIEQQVNPYIKEIMDEQQKKR